MYAPFFRINSAFIPPFPFPLSLLSLDSRLALHLRLSAISQESSRSPQTIPKTLPPLMELHGLCHDMEGHSIRIY